MPLSRPLARPLARLGAGLLLATACHHASAATHEPHTGAYGDQQVLDPAIVDEAQQAVGLLRTSRDDPSLHLGAVRAAATQVVAGVNYRFTLDLTSSAGPLRVTLGMYRDLQGNRQLTTVEGL